MKKIVSIAFISLFIQHQLFAIARNVKLSTGKTVVTSSGNAAYLVDNNYSGTGFTVSANTWIAIHVNVQRSGVYFSWNNPGYSWSDEIAKAGSCKQTMSMPTNYTIQKSNNSTNGSDGTWTTVATIASNVVTARAHTIDFSGAKWLKMNITSGGGTINEIEVFDTQGLGQDLWFFPGTSISANTYKGTVPAKNYADLIKQAYPSFTPSMVRAGIPCINSTQFRADMSQYLAVAGNAKYWAIEMGTNDGYNNGNSGVATFKSNMQAIITACKNAGIQPIIAKVIATNQTAAGWQIHADYGKAVDDLTTQNNLIAGPDLYTYFLNHPTELNSDGVHPNAAGAASIQRLWAEKMGPVLYTTVTANEEKTEVQKTNLYPNPSKNTLNIAGNLEYMTYSILNAQGAVCKKGAFNKTIDVSDLIQGIYILALKKEEYIEYISFEIN